MKKILLSSALSLSLIVEVNLHGWRWFNNADSSVVAQIWHYNKNTVKTAKDFNRISDYETQTGANFVPPNKPEPWRAGGDTGTDGFGYNAGRWPDNKIRRIVITDKSNDKILAQHGSDTGLAEGNYSLEPRDHGKFCMFFDKQCYDENGNPQTDVTDQNLRDCLLSPTQSKTVKKGARS